ncbi:hypothetical protein L3X38_041323 [Prunus dulcis]|uniref:PGG domain-containing protein n=1 Tax=Prunus dulcis TaxID=3755 RepID=A0AAD4USH3_PRUDU|nr:hypothetical protein L3X38_041323 [Prunus dulcis]
MLKAHPQAVDAHDIDNEQNILHMAIKHRRLAIFKILEKRKLTTSRLAYRIGKYGNTILHHVADMSFYSVDTKRISGPAFQLQEELRWMARVEKKRPPHYFMHRNNQGVTAKELFETAFTVPRGNDNRRVPVLRHSPFFITFTISDTISLICSLTSLGTFLSILTSPFEYENFHHSLPVRLHLGFALLFFSLVATMLTFTATIVLLIHHQKTWTTSLIYVVALLPVSVFGLTLFPLYEGFSQGFKYISKTIKKIKSSKGQNQSAVIALS